MSQPIIKTPERRLVFYCQFWTYFTFYAINVAEFEQINADWAWEMVERKFSSRNWKSYCPMVWENLLAYMFLFLFIKSCERINFHDTSGNISQTLNIIDKNMRNIYKLIRMSFLYICYDIFPSVALHTT